MWKLQENILEQSDKEYLLDFIRHTERFTQFTKVKEFENAWSNWQKTSFSVFVNSGSSADLVMLDAVKEFYRLPDDAEVLVPAVTWTTNITSVIQAKMKPVFVDINLRDFSFNYEDLEKRITPKTRIILVTHLIGVPARMDWIIEFADKHHLIVLEDCCESHGARYQNTQVGNFGVASTFSFYWGHHMTTIEGGVVCTNNEDLNDLFVLKRSHGLARELHPSKHQKYRDMYPDVDFNFLFLTFGYNFRNTEFHAAIGVEQLKKLDAYISIRNQNHKRFMEIVSRIQDRIFLFEDKGISSFCLPFIFRNSDDKNKLLQILASHKIESRPVIGANLLRQPCFSLYGNFSDYPNAEIVHNNGFYIGNNQFVNEDRLHLLDEIIRKVF